MLFYVEKQRFIKCGTLLNRTESANQRFKLLEKEIGLSILDETTPRNVNDFVIQMRSAIPKI